MDDKDVRQLRKMQSQVALYKAQQIPIKALADDLEFLLSHMEGAPQSWRQEMLSKLGVLEDTYAVALDKAGGALAARTMIGLPRQSAASSNSSTLSWSKPLRIRGRACRELSMAERRHSVKVPSEGAGC